MCSAASHMAVAEWYAAWVTGCILITVTNDQQSLEGPELLSALVHEGITYFRCGVQTLRALGDPRGNVYVPVLRIVEGEKRTRVKRRVCSAVLCCVLFCAVLCDSLAASYSPSTASYSLLLT